MILLKNSLFIVLLLAFCKSTIGQINKPAAYSLSYFGEMITHPGLKLGADFELKNWNRTKSFKKDSTKIITKNIYLSPQLGFFYHKRYQTGLFVIPEIKYTRQNPKGGFYEIGLGLGYMRTFIANTFEIKSNEEIVKLVSGNNYFVSNYFISFGNKLKGVKNYSLHYFIKPQFMLAMPNFPKRVGYFALEIGLKSSIK